jgi:hypothetical protein
VARKFLDLPEGSPQRALQDAVSARYRDNEAFFREVARRAKITADSASGSFYGFVGGRRPLSEAQRAVYVALLGVSADLLEAIEARRGTPSTRKRPDLLAELEAKVGVLVLGLETARKANVALQRRVLALEKAEKARQEEARSRSRRATPAKPQARKTA